ncbi:MAG: response regulator [Chroococcales cyanobacterium]
MNDFPRKPQLLLVEDNIAHVRLFQEALKDSKIFHEVAVVKNGVDAIAYLRQEDPYTSVSIPDLILLDLNLPKKDGREVLAELKADPKLKRIPVLVLTTSTNQEDIRNSYDLHANCYITKSRNLEQLLRTIRRIEEFWLDTVTLPSEGG